MNKAAGKKSTIGIAKIRECRDALKIKETFFEILDLMNTNGKIFIPKGARIFIKPNICFVKGYETGSTVDPFLVKYLIEWLQNNFDIKIITIGEADATQMRADVAFRVLGWYDLFNSASGVQLLNISKDLKRRIELNGLYFKTLEMSETYMSCDFLISFGKLKTHYPAGISCILKNQFGSNPVKNKAQFHKHLDAAICDLNKVKIPDLCIVDGIIAMEGDGPVSGMAKPFGVLIIGDDPVSVDHACAKIMGINPKRVKYLKLAEKQCLGNDKYDVIGIEIEKVRTKFKYGPPISRRVLAFVQRFVVWISRH